MSSNRPRLSTRDRHTAEGIYDATKSRGARKRLIMGYIIRVIIGSNTKPSHLGQWAAFRTKTFSTQYAIKLQDY